MIGSAHTVCQDYAIAGTRNGISYAIVSDGCSGSPNSDVGARILATVAAQVVTTELGSIGSRQVEEILSTGLGACEALGLDRSCLDATLLIAKQTANYFYVRMFGDGLVVARERETGNLLYTHVDFPSGYPAYLSYTLGGDPLGAFQRHSGQSSWVKSVEDGIILPDASTSVTRCIDVPAGEEFLTCGVLRLFDYELFDRVAVLSDGASSFVQQTQTNTSIVK